MMNIENLKIKIFADGANLFEMKQAYQGGIVKGFTTNPLLMKREGVGDYESFAKSVLKVIPDLPVSFEVFSDDFFSMEQEARRIVSWGRNVNVKIPITNTKGESSLPLIKRLLAEGFPLNITAILTIDQVRKVSTVLNPEAKVIVSVFAGRIADTGRDPVPYMEEAADILKEYPYAELLWASSRELLNIFQAESCGCHIITLTKDILKKIAMIGGDLEDLSIRMVKEFYHSAQLVKDEV